jgi:hypothetical protein
MAIYGKHEDKSKWYSSQEIKATSERNTIQLLAKDAVGIGGAKHYYFVYTNNQGKQSYVSAYPQNPLPPFGKIVMKTGEYKLNTPDFKDSIKVMTFSSPANNPKDVERSFSLLKKEFGRIESANISYGGLSKNSNSAALTALHNITLSADVSYENNAGPTGVFAPGNDDYLMPAEYSKKSNANGGESVAGTASNSGIASDIASTNNLHASKSKASSVAHQDVTSTKTDLSKVVALLKDNATEVKRQSGLDVNTDEGLGKAVMQYWKENNLDPKILKEQLPNMKESGIATTNSKTTSSVESRNGTDPKAELSKVVALLKNNAAEVKKQSGFDVTTDDGLGRAVMQYWKENNLDPKTLKEQLPNIKDSEFAIASAALTNNNAVETTKAKDFAVQR